MPFWLAFLTVAGPLLDDCWRRTSLYSADGISLFGKYIDEKKQSMAMMSKEGGTRRKKRSAFQN